MRTNTDRLIARERYRNNPAYKENKRAYYVTHREEIMNRNSEYYESHKYDEEYREKKRIYNREYYRANKEKYRLRYIKSKQAS